MFVQEAGAIVSPDTLVGMRHLGVSGNKDGMGVMFVDKGRVQFEKFLAKSDQDVVDLYEKHKHRAMAVHQRNQTLGTVTEQNVHPFKVTSIDDGDPWDIYMMHNGTIRDIQVDSTKADSYNFAEYFLRGYLRENPQAARSFHFNRIIGGLIGNSKLILLSASGDPNDAGCFTIVNSGKGRILQPGVWVSRKEAITPKTASSAPFNRSPIGFKPQEAPAKQTPLPLPPASTATTTKVTPVKNGEWMMQPNGLKLFQIKEEVTEPKLDIPPPDFSQRDELTVEEELEADDLALDLSVLGEMTEKQIEAVVEDSPHFIAKLLHIVSRAF